jgi:hypothetical protein
MKTYVSFISVFFLTTMSLSAQTLVKENKLWSNTWIGTDFSWPYGVKYESYYIKFQGDTIINDILYKKILRSDDKFQSEWYVYGAIREDSAKKIFTYNTNLHPGEVLLYDFGLEIGDSILIDSWYVPVTKVEYTKLQNFNDSIKQIELDGIFIWLEGIGSVGNSTGGILIGLPECYMLGKYQDIVCYYENDTLKYSNPRFESCFPDHIVHEVNDNYYANSVKILYTKNQIIFDFKQMTTTELFLKIYNIYGEILFEEKLVNSDNYILETENFIPGCYIYSIHSNQQYICGKIVIQSN